MHQLWRFGSGTTLPCFALSAHIRSAHARLRPAKEASRLFFLGAATPPNLGGEFHSDASRHSGNLIARAGGSFACTVVNVLNSYLLSIDAPKVNVLLPHHMGM